MSNTRQDTLSPTGLWGGIDSTALKLLAIGLMLLDHLWASVVPGSNWMHYAGRLAFPIFAFQIAEGYFHTSDRKQYQKRLLIAALLSEVPFDLLLISSPFFIFHQNVMFTLLLGLRAMDGLELLRQERTARAAGRALIRLGACGILSILGFVDYGLRGVLTILLFYVFRSVPFARLGQLAGMVLLHIVTFEGLTIPVTLGAFSYDFPTQGFAVLALIPIWLYNGKKGGGGRVLQYGAYLFYPVHMLLLHLLRTFL